jgi:hypothetical protein
MAAASKDVANFFMRHRQFKPVGIGRVGLGQALGDGEGGANVGQRSQ